LFYFLLLTFSFIFSFLTPHLRLLFCPLLLTPFSSSLFLLTFSHHSFFLSVPYVLFCLFCSIFFFFVLYLFLYFCLCHPHPPHLISSPLITSPLITSHHFNSPLISSHHLNSLSSFPSIGGQTSLPFPDCPTRMHVRAETHTDTQTTDISLIQARAAHAAIETESA
jgi:hypothetical protein